MEILIKENFDENLETIEKLDRSNDDKIELHQMRIFIEDLLEFPLRPEEFYSLAKSFPLDKDGKVLYRIYFQQIQKKHFPNQQQHSQQKSPLYSNRKSFLFS